MQGLPGNDGPPVSACRFMFISADSDIMHSLVSSCNLSITTSGLSADSILLSLGSPWKRGHPRRKRTAGKSAGRIMVKVS